MCSPAIAKMGRDRSEIRDTTISSIGPDPDVEAFVAQMASYAARGFEHIQLGLLTTEPAQLVKETVSKTVRRVADL